MMNNFNWFGTGFHLHMFFGFLLSLGILFLIIWVFKFADKKTLKKGTVWLLAVGIVGALLTTVLGFTFMSTQGREYFRDYFPGGCRTLTTQDGAQGAQLSIK